jgi:branched-subunit amino acid transport protein
MTDTLLLCLAMLAGGLITFATRAIFLISGERFTPGPRFRALLTYVPAAVLAALIAPEVLIREGAFVLSAGNPRLWAALLAGVVAFRTRSVLATISAGLAAVWLLQYWLA